MGPLPNARHEKFVGLLLEGKSASAAYAEAGYRADDGNAARLRANPKVVERLAELQAEVAKDAKVTVESLLSELEQARAKAVSLDQMSAAVKSISEKARISGLMAPQKIEIGDAGSFDHCTSAEGVIDELLRYSINPYHAVTDQDRRDLIEMFSRHSAETRAFIEGIKQRPYINVAPSAQKRLINGKARSVS
jgi:hypothetical protein